MLGNVLEEQSVWKSTLEVSEYINIYVCVDVHTSMCVITCFHKSACVSLCVWLLKLHTLSREVFAIVVTFKIIVLLGITMKKELKLKYYIIKGFFKA